jgi:hypothetical protein
MRAVKGVSLVGSHARRDGWMELTPLRVEQDRPGFESWFHLKYFPDP